LKNDLQKLMGAVSIGISKSLLSACKQPRHECERPLFLCFSTGATILQSHQIPSRYYKASTIDIRGISTIEIE
jgi:hypothetical protein